MRLMGLDVGDKTIGVAVSDQLGIAATPLVVIQRTPSMKKDAAEVRRLAEEQNVQRIIVGMPYMMDGSIGVQAEKVQAFVEFLRRRVNVPVEVWDERLTTSQAERRLIEMEVSWAARKKAIDKMAASVILQSYMDRQVSGEGGTNAEAANEE